MMKSNSLTNRILALALTLVMVLGMLPSGALAADTTVTVYFDNSETQWEVVCCLYEDAEGNLISAGDAGGEGVWQIPADSISVRFQNYLPGTPEDAAPAEGFLGTGYLPVVDGETYTYTPADAEPEVTYVAEVNGTKYETLAEAVAAAEPGTTVTLLGNASGAGVVIDKDITIDFGGYTYTLTEGVGSTNTPTNGLQLLSGNNVTLKNGTLTVAKANHNDFYILVQNYANLTVTDMTLDGTNLDKYSGTDGDSYALSINSGNVTVNGNTKIIANDQGNLAYAFDVCQYGSYAAPSVTIAGGTVNGNVDVSKIGNSTFTIIGGTFTDTSVAPYVVEDKKLNESGAVVAKDYIAEVGGKKFETLAAAVAAAEPGATVTLLSNASGTGVVINKDITIDFGGYTYTLTEGVGSTNTPTNGLQLLSGSDVTLKNGTLTVAEANRNDFYILVQNYADKLTVIDMTLDGANLDKYSATDGDSYALSNNSGKVTISGNTKIIANKDGDKAYAFDVCQFGDYAVPTVTLGEDFTGTIDGAIEVAEGLENNLTITGGTYTADVSAYVPIGYKQENGTVIVDSVIDTEAELRHYVALGGEVTLGANITLSGPITIDKNVTLNLNGYKLTLPDHDNYGVVVKDSLTINGDGYVHVNGKYGIGLSTSCTGGLTVNGGTFTGAGDCVYMIGAFNGKVTVNGGKFTSAYCVVNSFEGYNATIEINGGTLSADYPVLGVNVDVSDAATLNIGQFLCVIGNTYYHTLEAAVAAVQQGETITMLADTKASFNAGNATGSKSQNFTLDLNGHTLTLGPGVGSKGTNSNGLRVMAYSALTIRNGNVVCSSDAEDNIKMGIANYGTLVLDDVNLTAGALTQYTINNRGKLTLSGKTTVTNGSVKAITNDPYNKYYTENVNAELICDSADVTVGDVLVERYARTSDNQGSVVLSITAGQFGSITEDGETSIAVEGNISGGSYANDVSAYCVDGKTAELVGGKYEVRLEQNFSFAKAEHTVDYKEGLVIEANDNKLTAQGSNAVVYSIAAAEGTKAENASIDEKTGEVTVKGVGTFVITAKQEDDDTYASAEASYTLTVNKGESVITLKDDTAVNLTFGVGAYTMPIETVGDGKITYAISGNDALVAVEIKTNGELIFDNTVDRMGTFTVTITMAESDNYKGTSAVYTVTLDYAEAPAVPFTLSAEANDKGWYEVETLLLKPADGYQICLRENITKEDGWVDNNIAFANGVYDNVTIYLKDAQGNITEPVVVGTLQIDNVEPTAGIEIVNDVLHTIVEKIFFVTNEDITIKITAGDATSGIERVQLSRDSGESFDDLGAVSEAKIVLSAEYRDFIQVKVTDKAGREYILNSEYTIVADGKNPTLDSEFVGTDAESKDKDGKTVYFDNGVDFSVKYIVDENNLDLHDKNLNVTINNEAQTGWTLSDAGVVEKPLTGEGVYEITAVFTDVANNEPAEITDTYVIDTEAPTINLNPGETTIVNGVHYTAASGYGVDITINEALYDVYLEHGVKPVVTVKRNGQSYNYGALDWSANTATLKLSDNGVYEITVGYDNLVHKNVSETITVCVDHEAPVITLTHGINLEVNGIFYTKDENYGLQISLNEDLYDHYYNKGNGFKPVVTVNGKAANLDWSEPEAMLTLAENGVYEVVVTYENHLHKAETQKITICVDHEAPVITLTPDIELVENDVHYTSKENYGLKISLTEDLYQHYSENGGFEPEVTVTRNDAAYDCGSLTWTTETGSSVRETVLKLPVNGVYNVTVTYKNHLWEAETKTITICVDLDEPVMELTPDIDKQVNEVYYTSEVNYDLRISLNEDLYDHYFSNGEFEPKISVTRNDAAYDYGTLTWTTETGSPVRETVLTLPENGVYNVTVTYQNHLWEAETKTITICVDLDQPVITLTPDIDLVESDVCYTSLENYGLKISLNEDLYDHYFGNGNFEPQFTVTRDGANYDFEEPKWSESEDNPGVMEATLYLPDEGDYVVTVNYENHLWLAETESINITVDRTVPDVVISYLDGGGNAIVPIGENHMDEVVFANAVTAVITVRDRNFNAGKSNVTVVRSNPATETSFDQTQISSGWNNTEEDVWTYKLDLSEAADYRVDLTCYDYAENSNVLMQDETKVGVDVAVDIGELPDNIKFTYKNSVTGTVLEHLTLGFFNSQLTVTIEVQDDISGIKTMDVFYSVADDAYKAGNASGEYIGLKPVAIGENTYSVSFQVPAEILNKDNQVNGYVSVIAHDYADNVNLGNVDDKFKDGTRIVVDNINPERNVNITNAVNEVNGVKYYNGNIVLNANIFEANYRFYNDATVSVIKDGQNYNLAGHTTGWYKGEANATNTITLTEDGDYVVTITYTDGSGNTMTPYSSGNLTLDTIAPVITVSNIEQNSANKDEVYGFVITVSDINLDADTVKPLLTAVVQGEDGLYSNKQINLGEKQVSADGQTVTYTVENLDADALYTLTCTAEDMSDNVCSEIVLADGKAYETVNFSINRNGSTYGFGNEYAQDLVDQYFVYSVYEDVVIVEVNVDPIEKYTVTVNGIELVEGTDYTTEQSNEDDEWSKRTYTIKKEYFAAEGEYNVIVSSTDKAETTAYSDIKDLAIGFVVDQTAPVLNISGLQTGGRYQTEEQTVTMIPTDEGGRLNSLKVVVMNSNGEPLTDEDGNDISVRFESSGEELLDYLSANGDMVTFTIPSGLEHKVQIICNDCAVNAEGLTNETVETYDRVTVSQNALIIFYANKPAFYGTLAGVAALIILIIVLVKRKKNEKK